MKKTLCFVGGLCLTLSVLLCALMPTITQTERFERILVETVDALPDAQLSLFAEQTMPYLRGETNEWMPDVPFDISPDFAAHMAEVRGYARAALWVIVIGIAASAGLIFLGGLWRKPTLWGMLVAVVGILAAVLYAAVNFEAFWLLVHRWFIPGGLFGADEPIMQLFPPKLFAAYLRPVSITIGTALCAQLLFLVNVLKKEPKE